MKTASRRVFIVYRSPLFARGLSALLSQIPGLSVIGMSQESEEASGDWAHIRQGQPDVIILEHEDASPLDRVLNAGPDAQLISISLKNDNIWLYERRDFGGKGLEGVVSAITQDRKSRGVTNSRRVSKGGGTVSNNSG